jgi:hypothetical protein
MAKKAASKSSPPRRVVVQLKGTDEWKAWLEDLSKHLRMPISSVVDNALVSYAKAQGFVKSPPER